MPKIFISYRRDDAAGYAGRIHDRLANVFGSQYVFMDFDDLKPGMDFSHEIQKAVSSCDVLLALIGRQWATCRNADGRRRLEDPADFVRLEIATALARKVRIIPVLLNRAPIPAEADVPDELKPMFRHQAIELSEERWDYDLDRLADTLRGPRSVRRLAGAIGIGIAALVILMLAIFGPSSSAGVSGAWTATVRYEWGQSHVETFDFEQSGDVIRGTASFLTVDRSIEDGKLEDDHLEFMTRTFEEAGDESREALHHYRATLDGDELRFVMQTSGGFSTHPLISFVATRDQADEE